MGLAALSVDNRIFEGTNEINRLLIPGTAFKRAVQKRLGLYGAIGYLEKKLASGTLAALPDLSDQLAVAEFALQRLKDLTLLVAQAASARHGMQLEGEQETMVQLSNLMIDAYAIDSAVARTKQRVAAGGKEAVTQAICAVAAVEALDRAGPAVKRALHNLFEPEAAAPWLVKAEQLATDVPLALLPLRRLIAAEAVGRIGYKLSSY